VQQFGSSGCGSLLLQDCFLSIPAKLLATSGIVQQFINGARQLVRRLQLNTSVSFSETFDDIAEVPCIRAKQDTSSIRCRLHHVLTSSISKTAAYKCYVGQAPAGTQFSNRVQQNDGFVIHLRVLLRRILNRRTSQQWEVARRYQCGNFVESLAMSRNQNQTKLRVLSPQL
jgi:hypothetical protein